MNPFIELMNKAHEAQMEAAESKNGKFYKTAFAPPKKERKKAELSVNVKAFLERKEKEERERELEKERKRQELMALRNQDKKSSKRVQSMLKMTKSANKSVLEDAIDHNNTAVTITGCLQPDEDDYGYVSQEASSLYDKLINKYNSIPDEKCSERKSLKKTTGQIMDTKDRVKASLQREEEEKFLPRKRHRKEKEKGMAAAAVVSPKKQEEARPKVKVPKPPPPPPLDYATLIKMAETKQHEPILIPRKEVEEPERPLTEKEKTEHFRRKMKKILISKGRGKIGREGNEEGEETVYEPTSSSDKEGAFKKPSSVLMKEEQKKAAASKKEFKKPIVKSTVTPGKAAISYKKEALEQHKKAEMTESVKDISMCEVEKKMAAYKRELARLEAIKRSKESVAKNNQEIPKNDVVVKLKQPPSKVRGREEYRKELLGAVIAQKPGVPRKKQEKPSSGCIEDKISLARQKRRLPLDVRDSGKFVQEKKVESSEAARGKVKSIQFPPSDVRIPMCSKTASKRPKFLDSDEEDEEDSDMDDFIDDADDSKDYSSYISEIFGYDKSKYKDLDDDECMESNFSHIEREEYKSRLAGLKEDLEDIRRDKMRKARMAARKK